MTFIDRQHAIAAVIWDGPPGRKWTTVELASMLGMSLGETKAALRGMVKAGQLSKRTDPNKPTSNHYFRPSGGAS